MEKKYTGDGINKKTFDVLLGKDHYTIMNESKSSKEEALKLIELFTLLDEDDEEVMLDNYLRFDRVGSIYVYQSNMVQYAFERMDRHVNSDTARILKTKKRYGKCCSESFRLANESKEECSVIVGYIHYSDNKIIHAVFEREGLIYDYTKNLVMMKRDYFDLTNFEVLNVIDGKDIKADYPYIDKFIYIPLKLYLIYRDEVMRDLKKNKKVLELK